MNMKRTTQLVDLYWEDILVAKVLPYLTIRECFNFRCVSKTCLQIINMFFSKLKALKLMNKSFSSQTFGVSNIEISLCVWSMLQSRWMLWVLQVFTGTCTRLTVLNLSRCTHITDDDLIPMLMQNPGLINLNLSQCKNLTAKCLQPVILYCNNLKTLKLARCTWLTTGAMEALALHQSKLEDVDLSHCLCMSENCILIFIKKFRHLKTLNLEGNKQISDKCLYALSRYSTSLKLLNLTGCSNITDKGVRSEYYLFVHYHSNDSLQN